MNFVTKIFVFSLLLQASVARFVQRVPKFYGQDSAIIVDVDKPIPTLTSNDAISNSNPNHDHYRRIKTYPVYELIDDVNSAANFETTTAATAYPIDEFPKDLLEIAQQKLGLKRLDEIPSISELGELLGTRNAAETLQFIRQLTTTEQGVALMKAYIESTDYTDNGSSDSDDNDAISNDATNNDAIEWAQVKAIDTKQQQAEIVKQVAHQKHHKHSNDFNSHFKGSRLPHSTTTPRPLGFLERIYSYLNLNNLWPLKEPTPVMVRESSVIVQDAKPTTSTPTPPHRMLPPYVPAFIPAPPRLHGAPPVHVNLKRPLLVRPPLPYHYPIPLRPVMLPRRAEIRPTFPPTTIATSTTPRTTPRTTSTPITSTTLKVTTPAITEVPSITTETTSPPHPIVVRPDGGSTVHLNTPKALLPHVQNLLKVTAHKIRVPPKKLEEFLLGKPKLVELAARVSTFPVTHDRGAQIDAQLLAAVRKAIEQDDDLKKLFSVTETLK